MVAMAGGSRRRCHAKAGRPARGAALAISLAALCGAACGAPAGQAATAGPGQSLWFWGAVALAICVAQALAVWGLLLAGSRARRQAEAALRHSEERYRGVVEDQKELICRYGPDGVLTFANGACARAWGRRPDELVGMTVLDFVSEARRQSILHRPTLTKSDSTTMTVESQETLRDGRVRWFHWTDRVFFDKEGRVSEYQTVGRDITTQKRAQESLRESEERFRAITSSALDAIVMLDQDGKVRLWNRAAEEMFGWSEREALGRDWRTFVGPDRHLAEGVARNPAAGAAVEVLASRSDGATFPAELSLATVKLKGQLHDIAIVRDVTERRRIEEALRDSQQRLDLALRGAELGLWDWNLRTGEAIYDEQWAGMLGYGPNELAPRTDTFEQLVHPDDAPRALATLDAHLAGRAPAFECELRLRAKSGEWRWALMRGKVVERDETEAAVRAAGTNLDITLRKLAEEDLARARQRETAIQSQIQESLLRGRLPRGVEGAVVAALAEPSQFMDGDFYDFFTHDCQRFDVVVGDVMGKGVLAALVGAGTKSHFLRAMSALLARAAAATRTSATGGPDADIHSSVGMERSRGVWRLPSPRDVVSHVHGEVTPRLIGLEQFVTLCYARFDLAAGVLEWVDCGHTRSIHYRAATGRCGFLEGRNVPIGFAEHEVYEQLAVAIEPGDLFVFYSDGVTEALDPQKQFFTAERLAGLVQAHHALEPEALVRRLRQEVADFTQAPAFADDFTLIAVAVQAVGPRSPRTPPPVTAF